VVVVEAIVVPWVVVDWPGATILPVPKGLPGGICPLISKTKKLASKPFFIFEN
jgi:hypothetical protein